jgi:hypothetical protein
VKYLTALLLLFSGAFAQEVAPIRDNSFLVEEAYNQESGIVQHIGLFRTDKQLHNGVFVFTQEWPVISSRHQFSYSLPLSRVSQELHLENILLNYRYQIVQQKEISIAPRLTAILPVHNKGLSASTSGIEFNLPVSSELSDSWVMHVNAGGNFVSEKGDTETTSMKTRASFSGLSFVYLASSVFNIINEFTYAVEKTISGESAVAISSFTWNPGFRFAINLKSGAQLVPGFSLPLQNVDAKSELGLLFYLSFEHSFRKIK